MVQNNIFFLIYRQLHGVSFYISFFTFACCLLHCCCNNGITKKSYVNLIRNTPTLKPQKYMSAAQWSFVICFKSNKKRYITLAPCVDGFVHTSCCLSNQRCFQSSNSICPLALRGMEDHIQCVIK